jgi:hypothetical protein
MLTGFLVGFILPLVVFFAVYLFTSGERTFADYVSRIHSRDVVTHFISLCVFPNVFAFLLFNRLDKYKCSMGVLGMTIIWALFVFLLKMI